METKKKINKNLLEIAKAIYKDHFVDFSFNGGIQPSNWINGCIKDLSSQIITGKTPSTKDKNNYGNEVPFITIPDMHDSIYVVNTERYLSEKGALTQENKFLPKNSICVSCIGTSGLVSLVSQESQTNQQINSIIPKKDLSPYFIYLSMKYLSKNKNAFSVGGSTIDNLNKGQFEKIDIVIPTADILQKFHKIAKPIFDLILKNQMEIISLNKLKNFILPKLLSGEIEL
ncbi:MAG: restriction endonuclease subunit S [Allobaculum sp.]|nr:restriction endonuclease subunit S [Allobaculum sp.]